MKKIFKWASLGLIISLYFFIQPIQSILNHEFNVIGLNQFLAKSLFKNDESVASVPLYVKDYILKEDCLYVFPLTEEVCLPIDVMVVKIEEGQMEVISLDERFIIRNLKKHTSNLYQYVHSLNALGTTNDFFIVEGSAIKDIASRLVIYYEKI
ncbi:MAG: hypothetical protein K2I42_03150 [Anaeroplasmataceae bacterium]|nr:hypothetical protein [Anaeroplasmataceae bacterium]